MVRPTLVYGLIAGAFVFVAGSAMAAAPLAGKGSSPAVAVAAATPSPEPIRLFLPDDLPAELAELLRGGVGSLALSPGQRPVVSAPSPSEATAVLMLRPAGDAGNPAVLAQTTYAVVVPFATVTDEISAAELKARWEGAGQGRLLVSPAVAAALAPVLGPPAAAVQLSTDLLHDLQSMPGTVGILPFPQIDPRYKVLAIDGMNPLSNQFRPGGYPLYVEWMLVGRDGVELARQLPGALPITNRDPRRLTTLVMTGVTAMSRMTADRMEKKGVTYPAAVIGPVLRSADITHVSNEVPFIKGCKVNTSSSSLRFCSDPKYRAALAEIGTDIVGLSGNHVNDFGRKGALESLALYKDNSIPVYGSGLNEHEACAPLLLEHNGQKLVFLAALAYQPSSAWATPTEPGACHYDSNEAAILRSISDLKASGHIVAVELQFYESYKPSPTSRQVAVFRRLRDAGADIVTGVQSHVPQAMEPYGQADRGGSGMIVYGLGNLFFDQMWSWPTRTGLIARHTIYDGRLLNTEILTTVLMDYAQPRWATTKERAEILQRIFKGAPARSE